MGKFVKENSSFQMLVLILSGFGFLAHLVGFMLAVISLCSKASRSLPKRKCVLLIAITLSDMAIALIIGALELGLLSGMLSMSPVRKDRLEGRFPKRAELALPTINILNTTTNISDSTNKTLAFSLTIYNKVLLTLSPIIFMIYMFTMLMLSVNVLLTVFLHVRYTYFISPKRLALIMASAWVLGTISGLTVVFCMNLLKPKHLMKRLAPLRLSLHAFFLISTFVMFLCVVGRIRRGNRQTGRRRMAQFRLAYLIVASYVLLYIVPDLVIQIEIMAGRGKYIRHRLVQYFRILPVVGVLVDAIMFLVMEGGLRQETRFMFQRSKRKSTASRISNASIQH